MAFLKNNKINIDGDKNITIQNVTDSTITLNVNGELKEIEKKIEALEALMKEMNQGLRANNRIYEQGEIPTDIFQKIEINHYYYNEKKIGKYLGNIPTYPELFIGRKDEVETIHQLLRSEQNILLLVNGKGGVGKTTLASKYYHHYKYHYQHLVWVFSRTSILDALLTLVQPLEIEFESTQLTKEERLQVLLQHMAALNEPCLLVIDNANQLEDIKKYHAALLACSNFHIILTTRVTKTFHNTQSHKVEPLSKAEALSLFTLHYAEHEASENELFLSIFKAVNRNTLVVELLAKNLTNFNDKLEKRYTLDNLIKDISDNLLQLSESEEVDTFYQSESGIVRSETPENIIAAMYDLGELNDKEKIALSVFSVLPAENIPYARLKNLLEQEIRWNKIFIGLSDKGWLDYDIANAAFRISPVIQQVVRNQREELREDCQVLIDNIQHELRRDNLHIDNYLHSSILVNYAISILASFETADIDMLVICQNIGVFYNDTGDLNTALSFYKQYNKLSGSLVKEDPNNSEYKNGLAISYEKLGDTYRSMGELAKALGYYEERSRLGKELYENYPSNVSYKRGLAISYYKLGTIYQEENKGKALTYFQEAEQLFEELATAFPAYVQFTDGLKAIKQVIADL